MEHKTVMTAGGCIKGGYVMLVLFTLTLANKVDGHLRITVWKKMDIEGNPLAETVSLHLPKLDCCLSCLESTTCIGYFHKDNQCRLNFKKGKNGRATKGGKMGNSGWKYWSIVTGNMGKEGELQTPKQSDIPRTSPSPQELRAIKLHTRQGSLARMIVGTTANGNGFHKLDLKSGKWTKLTLTKPGQFRVGQFAHDSVNDRLFWTMKGAKLVWVKPDNLTALTEYYTYEEKHLRNQMFGLAIDHTAKLIFFTGKIYKDTFKPTWVLMSVKLGLSCSDPQIIKTDKEILYEELSHVVVDPENEMVYANQRSWNQITGCNYHGHKCQTHRIYTAGFMTPSDTAHKVFVMVIGKILTYDFSKKKTRNVVQQKEIFTSLLYAEEGLVIFTRKRVGYLFGSNKTMTPLLPLCPVRLYTVFML